MSLHEALAEHFPHARPQESYLRAVAARLTPLGFDAANTIACVGVCRDEMTRSFVEGVQRSWGEAFNFSSLGGLLLVGKTGMAAALGHAPDGFLLRRYVFFCMTHIGIDELGQLGVCRRPRQSKVSGACGALMAFRSELLQGRVNLELDPDDVEQSLLRRRLYPQLVNRPAPSLEELTRLAHDAIVEDLERAISLTVTPGSADYAVLTGIQIHAPEGHLVWPGRSYAVVGDVRQPLPLKP